MTRSDAGPRLFEPLRLRSLELDNRLVLSPMCQYSSQEGSATDWHLMHLGQYAVGGPGLLCMEMTNVVNRIKTCSKCSQPT